MSGRSHYTAHVQAGHAPGPRHVVNTLPAPLPDEAPVVGRQGTYIGVRFPFQPGFALEGCLVVHDVDGGWTLPGGTFAVGMQMPVMAALDACDAQTGLRDLDPLNLWRFAFIDDETTFLYTTTMLQDPPNFEHTFARRQIQPRKLTNAIGLVDYTMAGHPDKPLTVYDENGNVHPLQTGFQEGHMFYLRELQRFMYGNNSALFLWWIRDGHVQGDMDKALELHASCMDYLKHRKNTYRVHETLFQGEEENTYTFPVPEMMPGMVWRSARMQIRDLGYKEYHSAITRDKVTLKADAAVFWMAPAMVRILYSVFKRHATTRME